jgi:hypothetical protein
MCVLKVNRILFLYEIFSFLWRIIIIIIIMCSVVYYVIHVPTLFHVA